MAREKGWYGEAGLEVALAIPDSAYSITPASKVPPHLASRIALGLVSLTTSNTVTEDIEHRGAMLLTSSACTASQRALAPLIRKPPPAWRT